MRVTPFRPAWAVCSHERRGHHDALRRDRYRGKASSGKGRATRGLRTLTTLPGIARRAHNARVSSAKNAVPTSTTLRELSASTSMPCATPFITRRDSRNRSVLAGARPRSCKTCNILPMPIGLSDRRPCSDMIFCRACSISIRNVRTDMSGNSRASSSAVGSAVRYFAGSAGESLYCVTPIGLLESRKAYSTITSLRPLHRIIRWSADRPCA